MENRSTILPIDASATMLQFYINANPHLRELPWSRRHHRNPSLASAAAEAEGMTMIGWSSLPPDLVRLVGGRVALHADYIRFRAVCSSWRSAVPRKPNHLPVQLPFLLLPTDAAGARALYSVTEAKPYRLCLPGLQHHCLGSSHGWVILLGPSTSLTVLNPFTGAAFPLPPVTAIPFLFDTVGPADVLRCRAAAAGADWWKHFVHKAKVCWDRQSPAGHWVALAFPKAGLAMWRPGDRSWAHVGRYWRFADAEFCNGKLYAVTRGGILSIIDVAPSATPAAMETVHVSLPPFSYSDTAVYLVELAGDLLLVVRRFFCELDPPRRRTIGFEVFRLVEASWMHVDDLGDQMLIVERGTSISLSARGLEGCEANCIYFSDEDDMCREDQITGLDLGVFMLADSSIKQIDCYPLDTKLLWPPPVWIIPYLCSARYQIKSSKSGLPWSGQNRATAQERFESPSQAWEFGLSGDETCMTMPSERPRGHRSSRCHKLKNKIEQVSQRNLFNFTTQS